MYKIGLVLFKEQQDQFDYWREQLPTEWSVKLVDPKKINGSEKVNLLLFIENTLTQMEELCISLIRLQPQEDRLIWIWSEEDNKTNRLVYLNLNVDGVISPLTSMEEGRLLLKNALRRQKWYQEKMEMNQLGNEHFFLNPGQSSVVIDGEREVLLTRMEFIALNKLYQNNKKIVTYDELFEVLWKDDDKRLYRVMNLVFHLRKKIEREDETMPLIQTVRMKGYILNA